MSDRELTTWLEACFDEIERVAQAAFDAAVPIETTEGTELSGYADTIEDITVGFKDPASLAHQAHAARADPRSELARVRAERANACPTCGNTPIPCETRDGSGPDYRRRRAAQPCSDPAQPAPRRVTAPSRAPSPTVR